MLKSYLKIAVRNMLRHKGYIVMNVFGLALGVAMCLVAYQYVKDELSFDGFHRKADRIHQVIYNVSSEVRVGRGERHSSLTQPGLARELLEAYHEIAQVIRIKPDKNVVHYKDLSFTETLVFADKTFFSMFSFQLIHGDPTTVLENESGIVLSERAAQKYFGDANPLGEVVQVRLGESFKDFSVSGIARNVPGHSSIQFDFLLPYEQLGVLSRFYLDDWDGLLTYTFLELTPGASSEALEAKLPATVAKYHGGWLEGSGHKPDGVGYWLLPLTEIHFNNMVTSSASILPLGPPPGNLLYSFILIAIALIVLSIACINFVTYSIGHSALRAREVGVRKVFGAGRMDIVKQFWGEALLLALLALLVGLSLVELFIPAFNSLSGKSLSIDFWSERSNIVALMGIWIVVSFLAGIYPSVLLSGFQPARIFKDRLAVGKKRSWGRMLVSLQFTGVIVLSVCMLIMSEQLAFMQQRQLSLQGDQIMLVRNQKDGSRSLAQAYEIFKNKLAPYPFVQVTASYTTLGENFIRGTFENESGDGAFNTEDDVWTRQLLVDYNYIETYGHELLYGRNFSKDFAQDPSRSIIVNEAFVQALALIGPVGAIVKAPKSEWFEGETARVIGVVKDFHFESLHEPVAPAAFVLINGQGREWAGPRFISVKFRPADLSKVLELSRQIWHEIYPNLPFDYSFYDQRFAQLYRSETQWQQIVGFASAIGLLIASIGLFVLSTLAAINRKKEIGIRKVLGARAQDIVLGFSKELVKPIFIAFLFAAPIAYFVMERWLRSFAYKIDIGPDVFFQVGLGTFLIVSLTISFHALKTALANPVEALRYE